MEFKELKLKKPIVDAVAKAKYKEASPIQEKAIPQVLAGKDLIACAQTGTGKTAAFALPILDRLEVLPKHRIRTLVLTPTRELAIQIFENFKKYGRYLKLRTACIYGGAKQGAQVDALRKGCDILVATPGRLQDFMDQGIVSLGDIEIFVLDEADRMLDMGFIKDIYKIVPEMPQERQTLMFSATMPPEIEKLAEELLKDPAVIKIAATTTPAETVDQKICFVDRRDKKELIAELLKTPEVKKAVIFTRTKHGADRLVKDLDKRGVVSIAIHGDKTQGQRRNALQRFSSGNIKFLVATDVAARGLDVPKVSHVFNYELPMEPESYIHRIGRAGRAGASGEAVSFCSEEELDYLFEIEKMMGREIPEMLTDYSIPLERKKPGSRRSGGLRSRLKSAGRRNERGKKQAPEAKSGEQRKKHEERSGRRSAESNAGRRSSEKMSGRRPAENSSGSRDNRKSEQHSIFGRKKHSEARTAARAFARKSEFKISEEEGNQIMDNHGFWMVDWETIRKKHSFSGKSAGKERGEQGRGRRTAGGKRKAAAGKQSRGKSGGRTRGEKKQDKSAAN